MSLLLALTGSSVLDTPVNPGVGNIVLTGYAPTIAQTANQSITPSAGSIVITGYAPLITKTDNHAVLPAVGSIAITGYAPTISQSLGTNIIPDVGSIAITGYSPSITQSDIHFANPDVGSIVITGYAPLVEQANPSVLVNPDVGLMTITGYAPTVTQAPATIDCGLRWGDAWGKAWADAWGVACGVVNTTGAAYDYPIPKRKKYLVKIGESVLVFSNKDDAVSAINQEEKQAVESAIIAQSIEVDTNPKEVVINAVEVHQKPKLYDVSVMLKTLQQNAEIERLIAGNQYKKVIAAYEQFLDDEEVELLLMAM